jgi:ABC-type Fe3+-hydroxamate transport system substrate-binding protein
MIAGGANVLAGGPDYTAIDRERLIELNPPAIIQLLPAATPQVIEQANDFWRQMSDLSAVKAGRVHQITDADALLPATNAARVARKMAEALHAGR